MIKELKRPEKKTADVKVTDADMVYFSLGLGDSREFILPSQRKDYRSDERAVRLVEAIKAGKDMSHLDLSGLNLKGADLSGARFVGCNFKGTVFYKTNAQMCDFADCCFDDAYFEDTDLTGCDFAGATFKRAFFKNNQTEKAIFDEEAEKYLITLEEIIRLIESGKLDIRTLSKDDLLCLDVRRLDFSNIDISDLDLSVFALDGINLCGTNIDPKQLMSLEGWNSYCLDVRKMKEKSRERLCRKMMLENDEKLKAFQKSQIGKNTDIQTKNPTRPRRKETEREETRAWGIEKARAEFEQMQQAEQIKHQQETAKYLAEQNKKAQQSMQAEQKKQPTVSALTERPTQESNQAVLNPQTVVSSQQNTSDVVSELKVPTKGSIPIEKTAEKPQPNEQTVTVTKPDTTTQQNNQVQRVKIDTLGIPPEVAFKQAKQAEMATKTPSQTDNRNVWFYPTQQTQILTEEEAHKQAQKQALTEAQIQAQLLALAQTQALAEQQISAIDNKEQEPNTTQQPKKKAETTSETDSDEGEHTMTQTSKSSASHQQNEPIKIAGKMPKQRAVKGKLKG